MEPISILGATASAITVVQLCTEGLNSLLRLQKRFRNADLTVRLLVIQLSTLRTALNQISEWVDKSVHGALSRVLPDLNMSLEGCRFLIETLNDRLSRLEYDEDKALSMPKRARTVWDEKERTEFLTLLGHNISALQLLLTAMQCQSLSEQQVLLQYSANRDIITKARDDTSSLLWLRDDESHGTRKSTCTENSELLDSSFVFDRKILKSRAYLTAMKSNMKRAVREAHSRSKVKHSSRDNFEEVIQSEEDAHPTMEDTEGLQGTTVDFQPSTSFRSLISETQSDERSPAEILTRANGDFARESQDWNAVETAQFTPSHSGSMISAKGKHSPKTLEQGSRRLLRMPSLLKARTSISSQSPLDTEAASPKTAMRDEEKLLLIGNAKSSGYTILKSLELAYGGMHKTTVNDNDTIQETLISRRSTGVRYQYRVFDVIGLHSRENKWIYSFDEMSTLIFVVDISAYNLPVSDDGSSTCVRDDLALFQQICSSKWLAMTPVLLLLSSTDVLTSKLQDCPLAGYFPDYTGSSTDLEAVKVYFRQKFLCLNQKYGFKIWVVFTDSAATRKLGKVVLANIDKILNERKILAFGA